MKCTAHANIDRLIGNTSRRGIFDTTPIHYNARCVRPIGHAGLHRVILEDRVYEFSDLQAVFESCFVCPAEIEKMKHE